MFIVGDVVVVKYKIISDSFEHSRAHVCARDPTERVVLAVTHQHGMKTLNITCFSFV